MHHFFRLVALASLVLSAAAEASGGAPIVCPASGRYFQYTGHSLCGDASTTYKAAEGVDFIGYPAYASGFCPGTSTAACGVVTRFSSGVEQFPKPGAPGQYCSGKAPATVACTPGAVVGTTPIIPDTPAQCLARNKPDAGDPDGRGLADRVFLAGTAPITYCNGGCELSVYIATAPPYDGWNSFTGQAAQFTKHHQEATGNTCTGTAGQDADGNPANSLLDPSTQTAKTPAEWNCNTTAGTCNSPTGDLHYCTFTGSPPVRNTCVPAMGDADGDGIPNNRDIAPNDATNGEDTTGTEADNKSTGGGNCNAAPASSGDGIAAQVAYQTWATRCAVERLRETIVANDVSGGALDPADSARLEAIKNAQTLTNSKLDTTNSKLDTVASNAGAAAVASNATTTEVSKITKLLDGTTQSAHPDTGADPGNGAYVREEEYGGNLDVSGLTGSGGACPIIAPVNIMGHTIAFDTTVFCSWLKLAGILVVLSATILSLRILGSNT